MLPLLGNVGLVKEPEPTIDFLIYSQSYFPSNITSERSGDLNLPLFQEYTYLRKKICNKQSEKSNISLRGRGLSHRTAALQPASN